MESSIRTQGIKKLLLGTIAGVLAAYFVYWLQLQGYHPNSFALVGLGAPAAWGLVGLLEVLMNRPFSEMEDWWGGLRGWQRGVLGLLVVVIAFALLMGAVAAAGMLGLI
ncbi:MAG TPA: hypothetical protein VFR01_08675 [Geobacterales bacterium]|nr:hypothetical protein [Geobacterales bacterium]